MTRNIQDTIKALDELAAEPRENSYEALDDLGTAEALLLDCVPALAPAAMRHMMQRFLRKSGIVDFYTTVPTNESELSA